MGGAYVPLRDLIGTSLRQFLGCCGERHCWRCFRERNHIGFSVYFYSTVHPFGSGSEPVILSIHSPTVETFTPPSGISIKGASFTLVALSLANKARVLFYKIKIPGGGEGSRTLVRCSYSTTSGRYRPTMKHGASYGTRTHVSGLADRRTCRCTKNAKLIGASSAIPTLGWKPSLAGFAPGYAPSRL